MGAYGGTESVRLVPEPIDFDLSGSVLALGGQVDDVLVDSSQKERTEKDLKGKEVRITEVSRRLCH